MNEQIAQLQAQVAELMAWKAARETQPIAQPLDDVSKALIGAATDIGPGSTALTQNITIGAGGGTAPVPKAYAGSELLSIKGVIREFPYLS